MFTAKHLVIKRMLPENKCANVIAFGSTKPDKSIKVIPTYDDPYKGESIAAADINISLFKGAESGGITQYDPQKQVNICEAITDWLFYSIRDLKHMLSAFIGVPVAHVDMRAEYSSKSFGHVYDEEEDTVASIDAFRKITILPATIELYLWGDWKSADDVLKRWPEIESAKEGVYVISPQARQSKERIFVRREEIIRKLAKQETIKGMRGNIISTEISTIHAGFGVDIRRLFEFLTLTNQITSIYYRTGNKVVVRAAPDEKEITRLIIPAEGDKIAVQMMLDDDMPKQHRPIAPKHFIVSIDSSGIVSASAGWTDTRGLNNEDIIQISRSAIRVLVSAIEAMPIEHYTFPVHRFNFASEALRTARLSYYELFRAKDGKAFMKLQNIVSDLAKEGLAAVHFTGEVKMTYTIPVGDSKDRLIKFADHAFIRGDVGNAQSVWRDKEFRHENLDKFLFAPKITVIHEPKANMIHCKLSNTSNEFEMALSREIFRRTAQLAGFTILPRDSVISIGKVSLTLLDNVDPVLFASRQLRSGKAQTFSRSCQGAPAHPVPLSSAAAARVDKDRIIKLKNFTYGGYQYYYCRNDTHKYPTIRHAGDSWYIPCCISVKYEPGSLKSREYYTGAKHLFYEQSDLDALLAGLRRSVYLEPVQYTGQELPEGRLATLPKGVRQLFALNVFMFSPMGVDTRSFADVISFLVGEEVELRSTGANMAIGKALMELLKQSILVAVLELTQVSGKTWNAEILAPENELYTVSADSYLVFKCDQNYYPAVNADAKRIKCPQNIVETFVRGRVSSTKVPFSVANIAEHFTVEAQFTHAHKTYGLLIRAANRMYFPVIPTEEVPGINSISVREIKKYLPTMAALSKVLAKLDTNGEVMLVLRDQRGRVHGFEFAGEPALFLVQSTPQFTYPLAVGAKEFVVTESEIQRLIKLPNPANYRSGIAESTARLVLITMLFVADRLIRKVPLKRWKNTFDDSRKLISAIEAVFIKNVSARTTMSLYGDNILLPERPFAVPRTILSGAITRLVEKGPREFNLFYAYLATLGARIDKDKFVAQKNTKLLIDTV